MTKKSIKMNRQERIAHAAAHYEDIKTRLAAQTADSIKRTRVYNPRLLLTEVEPVRDKELRLVDLDSASCLFSLPRDRKICILNYASYKSPGGFFLGGSSAQEEALCYESNLYPILLAFDDTYYAWNRKNLNRSLYIDRALYTPDVVFERNGETRLADVLTCAAPNYYSEKVSEKENLEAFRQRIDFAFSIIEENGTDILIAGAWGCGVFNQDPEKTCLMMIDASRLYNFDIYFAIPDKESKNYKGFSKYVCGKSLEGQVS